MSRRSTSVLSGRSSRSGLRGTSSSSKNNSGTVTPTLFSELSLTDDEKKTTSSSKGSKKKSSIKGASASSSSSTAAAAVVAAANKRLKASSGAAVTTTAAEETENEAAASVAAPFSLSIGEDKKPGWVYLFGSGDCGQLGMGEEVDSRKRPTLHPFLRDKQIVSVCAGGLHNLALTAQGQVYSWGCNDEKALGHDAPEYSVGLVQGALADKKVVQVACGDSISAALTSEGHVYAWGTFRDSRGVLGFDENTVRLKYCRNFVLSTQ